MVCDCKYTTFLEKNIFNAVEKYTLDSDGTIQTEFSFNKGGFDGEENHIKPRGFIKDTNSNALWGMQFIWPIKADLELYTLPMTIPTPLSREINEIMFG